MQNYMLERLLERISLSPYKHNFIIKGGFLVSAIVGLDTRATMDLDTTIKGFTLTHEAILSIFKDVCAVQIDDDAQFEIVGVADIRETDDYPGIRVSLKANYPPISVPLTVDVTTGDKITPREIEYTFSTLFDDRTFSVLAYNLETVLAEKLETVLSRNIANTRPRDYYDIYILSTLRGDECDKALLRQAMERTAEKRGRLARAENAEQLCRCPGGRLLREGSRVGGRKRRREGRERDRIRSRHQLHPCADRHLPVARAAVPGIRRRKPVR